jgi:hypothetical protein
MDKAPGLKIIILIFIIFIISISIYFLWYSKIEKLTTQQLNSIQNTLLQKNIELTWEKIYKSGFPYRVEKKINNINIKFQNTNITTKNLKIIYQPWDIKHIIFQIPNEIKILNNNKNNITIANSNILASLIIDKFFKKRISITSNNITFLVNKKVYDFGKSEIYFKTDNTANLKYAILIDKLSWPPVFINNNTINKLSINGEIIKYKNIDINNYYKWFSNEGGIRIETFKINIDEAEITGNAFISLDKNLDIQSSASLNSNKLNNIFILLEKNNVISTNILKTADLIIKAIEMSSEALNKKANYSISIQNGYLNLMGIKLLTVPNLKNYF